MKEKIKNMIKIINDNNIDKDVRLMFALDLLYEDEISFDKFKEVLDECNCFAENKVNAEKKANEYWNNLSSNCK